MSSPPSRSGKLPTKQDTSKPRDSKALEPNEISGVEEIHALLIDSYIFVSIAHEIEQDERWADRTLVLMRVANDSVEQALQKVERLIREIYQRRKRQPKKSR